MERISATDPAAQEHLNQLRATNNRVDHRTFKALTNLMEEYLAYFEKGETSQLNGRLFSQYLFIL
jgi:hypothetical protein